MEVLMRLRTLAALTVPLLFLGAGSAVSADPKPSGEILAGGEAIEFGKFDCVANNADGQVKWDCPEQTFGSRFREAPTVYFSIAGVARVTGTEGGVSVAVGTTGEVTQQGFQPALQTTLAAAAGPTQAAEKATVNVNWIAVGPGERVHRAKREREPKPKRVQ
jgi:hypothetical protein